MKNASIAGREAERKSEIAKIDKTAASRKEQFDKQNIQAGLAVIKAQVEWQESLDKAAAGVTDQEKPPGWRNFDMNFGATGIAEDSNNLESKGTFNALAAGRMGADSLAERQAKAAESTAENTRRLLQQALRGRFVFGA